MHSIENISYVLKNYIKQRVNVDKNTKLSKNTSQCSSEPKSLNNKTEDDQFLTSHWIKNTEYL